MNEEHKGVVLALAVIFVLAMIPIGIGIHNDYKSKHRVLSPEKQKEIVERSRYNGLEYSRDVVMYLKEAANARTAERRANMLDEAMSHASDAAMEFYSVDDMTGMKRGGCDIMYAVADSIYVEQVKYEMMPYNQRLVKTSYQWLIVKVWDAIDLYYE